MEIDGIVGLLLLGLWLFAIFDVISTDNATVRNLPKPLWLLVVILLPDVGAIAWLFLGRPTKSGPRPGVTPVRRPRARPRPTAREEEADFIARIEARDRMLAQWAEEDRRKAEAAGPSDRLPNGSGGAGTPAMPNQDEIDQRLKQWEAELAGDDRGELHRHEDRGDSQP